MITNMNLYPKNSEGCWWRGGYWLPRSVLLKRPPWPLCSKWTKEQGKLGKKDQIICKCDNKTTQIPDNVIYGLL